MQNMSDLVLSGIQSKVVLGAGQSLERITEHLVNSEVQDTIEFYSSLEIMNLLCVQVLYEFSSTLSKQLEAKIHDIKFELLKFCMRDHDIEFVLSVPLLR